jgi:antitoxin PrlF
MLATVTDKGQITLPKALRDALAIDPGSKIEFVLQDDQTVRMRVLPRGSAGLYGLLAVPGEAARTLEDIEAGTSRAVAQRHRVG